MGRSVEVKSYDYEQLVKEIKAYYKTADSSLIEKILLAGGDKIGDRYIILNNEFWETYDSYYNVTSVLDEYLGNEELENVFGNVFCTRDKKADCRSVAPSMSKEEIYQACELGEYATE